MLRAEGKFVLLSVHGKQLAAFTLQRTGITDMKLAGLQLIILRGSTLEVRDARKGTLRHRWTIARSIAGTALEDAQGNFAVYTAGIAIHVLRLSDGRDQVIAIEDEAEPAHADLEPTGLYYSYNTSSGTAAGRVALVPYARLAAAFATASMSK